MSSLKFLATIAWIFITGAAYAVMFLDEPVMLIYLKWLVFVAMLFAPLIWSTTKDLRKPKGGV